MIVAPAVDVRGGRCVQWVGGSPDQERVSLPDPVEAAQRWWRLGFEALHVVDLDAALGSGDNLDLLLDLVGSTPASIQVGGGVRDDALAARLLGAGADRVIVGTRAIDDPAWLEALSGTWPRRVLLAADHRDGVVLRRGWTEASALTLDALVDQVADLPLAGVLVTDVGREGRMGGVDADAVAATVARSRRPVWASGGIGGREDLCRLAEAGAEGAVVGMALYTGALDAAEVAARWGRRENG